MDGTTREEEEDKLGVAWAVVLLADGPGVALEVSVRILLSAFPYPSRRKHAVDFFFCFLRLLFFAWFSLLLRSFVASLGALYV